MLLTIEDYQKITNKPENIADLLAMPHAEEIDFNPPRLTGRLHRPAKLS